MFDMQPLRRHQVPSVLHATGEEGKKSHRTSTDDDEEEEDIPENGNNVSMFLDLECRQGGDEPMEDDETPTSSELLFFDFECRQENGTHITRNCRHGCLHFLNELTVHVIMVP